MSQIYSHLFIKLGTSVCEDLFNNMLEEQLMLSIM